MIAHKKRTQLSAKSIPAPQTINTASGGRRMLMMVIPTRYVNPLIMFARVLVGCLKILLQG